MGVLPLTFEDGASWQSIGLKGDETVTIRGLQGDLKPRQKLTRRSFPAMARCNASRCCAASIRWTSWSTYRNGASCTMCCASCCVTPDVMAPHCEVSGS